MHMTGYFPQTPHKGKQGSRLSTWESFHAWSLGFGSSYPGEHYITWLDPSSHQHGTSTP